ETTTPETSIVVSASPGRRWEIRRKGGLSLTHQSARSAVIFAQYPLWLDALQILLERLELRVLGRTHRQSDAERLIDVHRPDVLIADLDAIPDAERPAFL